MSDDKMQATGLYVVRLVHRLKDGQYYVERHEVFAPITDIGRYHTGAVHDCKGPLDWDSAKDWLRTNFETFTSSFSPTVNVMASGLCLA